MCCKDKEDNPDQAVGWGKTANPKIDGSKSSWGGIVAEIDVYKDGGNRWTHDVAIKLAPGAKEVESSTKYAVAAYCPEGAHVAIIYISHGSNPKFRFHPVNNQLKTKKNASVCFAIYERDSVD